MKEGDEKKRELGSGLDEIHTGAVESGSILGPAASSLWRVDAAPQTLLICRVHSPRPFYSTRFSCVFSFTAMFFCFKGAL